MGDLARHDDAADGSGPGRPNRNAGPEVNVSMPASVDVELVQANSLREYEVSAGIVGVSLSGLVAVAVAWVGAAREHWVVYSVVAIALLVVLGLGAINAVLKRRSMRKTATVTYRTMEVEVSKG